MQDYLLAQFKRYLTLRRFSATLDGLMSAVRCQSESELLVSVAGALEEVMSAEIELLKKGTPDLVPVKRGLAEAIRKHMGEPGSGLKPALELARKMASLDPGDLNLVSLYLALFKLANMDALNAFKSLGAQHVAVHMTCIPRLARAQESEKSFEAVPSEVLCHIHLIGGGDGFDFDAATRVLSVPAEDTYEHLPGKVFEAYAFLAMAGVNGAVLKLDDDHRLGDAERLITVLNKVVLRGKPAQYGFKFSTPYPSAHNRAWHFGKCGGREVGNEPMSFPIPLEWATGEYGYVLSPGALDRFMWANLFFKSWLEGIIYEDVAISEACEKLGVILKHQEMKGLINIHGAY